MKRNKSYHKIARIALPRKRKITVTSNTSPKAVWQAAESHLNSKFYDLNVPAVREAWERDRDWFRENRTSTVRIRRVKPAETWLARAMAAVDPEASLWVALIHHQRLRDRRRAAGVGIYFRRDFPALRFTKNCEPRRAA